MSKIGCADGRIGVCQGSGGIDLTLGLEDYVFILVPAAVLVLLAPVRVKRIWRWSVKVVRPTALWWGKSILSVLFVAFSLVILIRACLRPRTPSAEIPAQVLSFLASVTAAALSQWEHTRSIKPSALLQLYLMVAVIVQVVHLRSVWLRYEDPVMNGLGIGQVVSCAAFLAVESISKESILLQRQKLSPQDVNGLFSQRLFWWLNHLFKRGYRSILAPSDLDQMDEDLASIEPQRRFRLEWRKHYISNPDVHLFRIVFAALRYDILFPIIPRALLLAFNFAQPYLIQRLIKYVEIGDQGRTEEGMLLVLATAFEYIAIATVQSWYWQSVSRLQTKLRGCLIVAIHDKALRSRPDSRSSPLMLMNVDVEKVMFGIRPFHEYWSCMIAIGVGMSLLYGQVGIPFLAPFVLLLIFVVVTSTNGTKVAPKQKTWLSATQERVSYITGVIGSMKNIKLLGIGPSVLKSGNNMRKIEVEAQKAIRQSAMINLIISLTTFQSVTLVLFSAYAIKTYLNGQSLTNDNLFTTLAVLKLFTAPMLGTIQYIPHTMQAFAALTRIQTYLVSKDHEDQRIVDEKSMTYRHASKTNVSVSDGHIIAEARGLSCGYSTSVSVLRGVTCSFKKGELNMVVGSVGSGKSTLLKALLGEVVFTEGSVIVADGEIAYCSQTPWLWNGTIQENVIGVSELDEAWLNKVTWACGLNQDFLQLQKGIHTCVGNDGTALSGGQKNRVSLARAVYARKRLILMDDMLSGLDTRTESLVFNRVLGPRGLLKKLGTTVVLATHSTGWLRYADKVLVIESGMISYQGSPKQAPPYLVRNQDKEEPEQSREDMPEAAAGEEIRPEPGNIPTPITGRQSTVQLYEDYLTSFGKFGLTAWILMMIGYSVFQVLQTMSLKWWAAADAKSPAELGKYVGIFAAITIGSIACTTTLLMHSFLYLFPKSSLYLHAKQFSALIKIRFSAWGDKETGSIANRFSQDIAIVDTQLSSSLLNSCASIFNMISSTAVIVVASFRVAIALPFVAGVAWAVQSVYLHTSKQLRVMDLEAKAPLCTHFLETVSGVMTIKAFGWSQAYREMNGKLLENSQVPYYLMESIQNWLTLVLSLVVAGLATLVMAVVVSLNDSNDAGFVGLALLNIMDLGNILETLVVAWTQLETSMGAIARMNEFMTSMPEEEEGKVKPQPDWLSEGTIRISNLEAAYSDTSAPTIKDVNLTVKAGEKIAICGRTGSGKSTLASAMFGLLHITAGSVEIDGMDVTQVSQDLLRSKMIALPQDPYFTPGTVRENLILRDSEAQHSDPELLNALDRVGLKEKFETLAASSESTALSLPLSPNEMLTKGQTQLFAMARAILSQGQILVIDEATSGLDHATETKIQDLLKAEFSGRTVIAIAHHLHTILDFDTVVVLDHGRVVEIGKPGLLRQSQGTVFGELYRAAE